MKISAVYIAKNEGKNIARSLESIKDAVDELILVDTGSTDNTVDIFKSYGGKVFYQEWQDDFSAPRNLALSKATGDWIIILDADESFSKDTRQNIGQVLRIAAPESNGLLINMTNYDKDTGEALDEFYSLRIVRNIKGLNYKGRIHETLHIGDEELSNAQRVTKEILSIDHTGYTTSISQEKHQRNLRLMEKAIAAGDPEERYYTSLYETYAAIGNMKKAIHYAKLDVARGRQLVTYASRSYRGLMRYYAEDNSSAGKIRRAQFVQQAVEDFPELPDFHAEYSECLYQLGKYQEAKQEIEKAITLYESYDGMEPCLLTPKMVRLMDKRRQEMTALAKKQTDVKISACAIVRNEEKNIRGWLENVNVFADEIIINDTGSEDSTKEVIAKFSEENPAMPIVLLESMWQDDFSLAKNQCLAEATGDWVVFTDADETFKTPEKVRNYIVDQANTGVQVIFVPMANIDQDENNRVMNVFTVPRIFHREEELQYRGRIHEEISINNQTIDCLQTCFADNHLAMLHTGYSSKINIQKAKRNLDLLLQDIASGQNIEKKYLYLAECYYTLGDYDKALNNALLATQSSYQALGHQGDMYWLSLNAMEKLNYPIEDRMAVVENGIALFPDLPDFYARKGMLLIENGQHQAAIGCFEKSLKILEDYNKSPLTSNSSNIMSVLHEVYADLGICLIHIGEKQAAEVMYKTAVTINPWTEKALCHWADIYNGRPDKEFLQELSKIYAGIENSREMLTGIFAINGFIELAEYYSDGEYYLPIKIKDYEDIYNKSMKDMAEILPALYVCLLEKYQEEYVKILPNNLQRVVNVFYGRDQGEVLNNCFEDYLTFLPEVISFARKDTGERYLHLLESFSTSNDEAEKQLLSVAEKLLKCHQEELALSFYQRISADSEHVNEKFWQNVGICFYGLDQFEQALECFGRALKDKKTEAYVVWCRERMKNED